MRKEKKKKEQKKKGSEVLNSKLCLLWLLSSVVQNKPECPNAKHPNAVY